MWRSGLLSNVVWRFYKLQHLYLFTPLHPSKGDNCDKYCRENRPYKEPLAYILYVFIFYVNDRVRLINSVTNFIWRDGTFFWQLVHGRLFSIIGIITTYSQIKDICLIFDWVYRTYIRISIDSRINNSLASYTISHIATL